MLHMEILFNGENLATCTGDNVQVPSVGETVYLDTGKYSFGFRVTRRTWVLKASEQRVNVHVERA